MALPYNSKVSNGIVSLFLTASILKGTNVNGHAAKEQQKRYRPAEGQNVQDSPGAVVFKHGEGVARGFLHEKLNHLLYLII